MQNILEGKHYFTKIDETNKIRELKMKDVLHISLDTRKSVIQSKCSPEAIGF